MLLWCYKVLCFVYRWNLSNIIHMQESGTIESFNGNMARALLQIFPDIGLDPVKLYSSWSSFHNTVQPHFSKIEQPHSGILVYIVC